MVTTMIRIKARSGKDQEVIKRLEWFGEQTRNEPGNRGFDFYRSASDPTAFFVYEEFVDEAAHQAHSASEHDRGERVKMAALAEWVKAVYAPGENWFDVALGEGWDKAGR